jgi:hypothetical protein
MEGKKPTVDDILPLLVALLVGMLISALVYIFAGPEFYKHWIGH